MCLIAVAVGAPKFLLVIAANREEDYDRPTLPAAFWGDAPDVLGGRDALHLGSWLAVTRGGRFAAVTNLHGSPRDLQKRSRGELVSAFVTGKAAPLQYVRDVAARAEEYAGFHLMAGQAGGEIAQYSGSVRVLREGVHGLSNAPAGERWAKVQTAEEEMHKLLLIDDAGDLVAATLQFLAAPRGTNEVESEVFIAGERYGTRSSTAIVVAGDHIVFAEQSYARGGVRDGAPRQFRFAISPP